jgi:signal transduction histidine kinase
MVLSSLSDDARRVARGEAPAALGNTGAPALLLAWESLSGLVVRGEALNLDRTQLLHAMAHELRTACRNQAA